MRTVAFCVVAWAASTMCLAADPATNALGPGGVGALGRIAQRAPMMFAPKLFSEGTNFMRNLQVLPPAQFEPAELTDPNLLADEFACERNYQASCPIGFVPVGEVFGDGERCAADKSKYSGKCADRTIKFVRLTKKAKQRWAEVCGFQWPCRRCLKNFTDPCPVGWSTDLSKGENSTTCLASASYVGPCDRSYDFSLMNDVSKEEWSFECHAYWPCQ